MMRLLLAILLLLPQDAAAILKKADALLEEAKTAYEAARSKSSVEAYVEASFKLEEVRIKYLVLQEIGTPDQQKIAGDRIRAVNQLGKLIHDGKVAISGAAVDVPFVKPADPAAPVDAPPAGLKSVGDATARALVPDATKTKDAERLIRDLFKDQYAKKAPADRLLLIRNLMDQAAQSASSPVDQWVLWHEAQDLATQACDVATVLEAIEAQARVFDVDALTLKNTALASLSKTAKSPDEFTAVTVALNRLVDELIAVDQYDVAEKAAGAAAISVRRANDTALAARTASRARDMTEAKTKFQSMKSFLETLARNPEDGPANLEMGQFLCFVKGNWDLGLRFLAKGSDPVLKGAAEKDIALPQDSAAQAAVADAWWEMAQKEKSATRKDRLLERARTWYQAALAQANGLIKVKIERRMAELGPEGRSGVDLLKLVDPRQDFVRGGTWKASGTRLVSPPEAPKGEMSVIRVPYIPPAEYDLAMTIQKLEEKRGLDGSLDVGLTYPGSGFSVVLDSREGIMFLTGIEGANHGGTDVRFKVFTTLKPRNIVISLRKTGVTVTVDGTVAMKWMGDTTRANADYGADRECLFLAAWIGFSISRFELTPVTGSGRKKR